MKNLNLRLSDTVVAVSNALVEAEIDDEVIALSIEHGTCYGMNRVGSRIWKLVKVPIRIRDLHKQLLSLYQVDPDVCERQLVDLLEEFRAEGLIEVAEQ